MGDRGDLRPRERSLFLPTLLLGLAATVALGSGVVERALQLRQLEAAATGLAPAVEAATRLRSALDGVATATAKLAQDGNPNARAVVEELRRRGVTIDPEKALKP